MKQILIISLLFISACTGSKKSTDKSGNSKEFSAAETLKRVEANKLVFDRLNSNADLNIKSAMFSGSVSAKIRMIRDSVVWISASKLGFEVGRIMVTQDSVFAVERLQKTYVRESISELSGLAGFDLDFESLQDILVGNPFLHPINNEVVYFDKDSIQIFPAFEEIKMSHILRNTDFKLLKTKVRDEKSKTDVTINFSDYQTLDEGQLFSYFREFFIDNENELAVTFKNTEINTEKSIKFSIPPSYTPRKL